MILWKKTDSPAPAQPNPNVRNSLDTTRGDAPLRRAARNQDREILGICEGAKEDKGGLERVHGASQECGLSAAEFFPGAAWERCNRGLVPQTFSHVPSTKLREIAAMLKAIHAGEDIVAAREKAIRVIEKLRTLRLTRAADLVEAAVEKTLAYYALP